MSNQERLENAIESLRDGNDLSGVVLGGERMGYSGVPIVLLAKLLERTVTTLRSHLQRMGIRVFVESEGRRRSYINREDSIRFLEEWSKRMHSEAEFLHKFLLADDGRNLNKFKDALESIQLEGS